MGLTLTCPKFRRPWRCEDQAGSATSSGSTTRSPADDQNDSVISLSYPSPIVPNESARPAARILLVNAQDVNCTP